MCVCVRVCVCVIAFLPVGHCHIEEGSNFSEVYLLLDSIHKINVKLNFENLYRLGVAT